MVVVQFWLTMLAVLRMLSIRYRSQRVIQFGLNGILSDCYSTMVSLCGNIGDNGVYNSAEFEAEIEKGSQSITYSGVRVQHQNGVAERAI